MMTDIIATLFIERYLRTLTSWLLIFPQHSKQRFTQAPCPDGSTQTSLVLMQKQKPRAAIYRAVTRETRKSKTQKTMQKNRATQPPIDLGNAFWVQKRLKSSRCLLSLLIHSLFISASSAWAQLHCKIPVTDRQPPKSPNFSRQPHLLYFSRMGFTRKEVRQKLSKACSQRRLRHYTALHLRPFTCVSWKDTWSS